MTFHDISPDTPDYLNREAEMKKLISLLQENLDSNDRATVPAVVGNVVVETRFTPQAAERLKNHVGEAGKVYL
jgi:hypothetical protein